MLLASLSSRLRTAQPKRGMNACSKHGGMHGRGLTVIATCACIAGTGCGAHRARAPIRVATAADLAIAFRDIAASFHAQTGRSVILVLGNTVQLTQQIENGAPYDVFAAADEAHPAELNGKGYVASGTLRDFAQGQLVICTRSDGPPCPSDPAQLAGERYTRIAIANPQYAPYGQAARQALEKRGVWVKLAPRLVYGANIQQTLQYVTSGNADAGLVARSLVSGQPVHYTLVDSGLYRPIRQALVVLKQSHRLRAARRFAEFVTGSVGRATLTRMGFKPLARALERPATGPGMN